MAFGAVMTWQSISMGVESKAATEAGTSPVGIGGTLEQFPSVLSPAYPESEPLSWRAHGLEAPSPNSRFQTVPVQIDPPYPIYLPTHVELPLPPVAATVAAAAAPVQYNVGGDVEQWRSLVASIFPAFAVEAALRIIKCESGGNPLATGSAGERGLFQVHPLHFDSDYDPRLNTLAAYRISGGGTSWAAWSCRP